jgi:glutaredoxin
MTGGAVGAVAAITAAVEALSVSDRRAVRRSSTSATTLTTAERNRIQDQHGARAGSRASTMRSSATGGSSEMQAFEQAAAAASARGAMTRSRSRSRSRPRSLSLMASIAAAQDAQDGGDSEPNNERSLSDSQPRHRSGGADRLRTELRATRRASIRTSSSNTSLRTAFTGDEEEQKRQRAEMIATAKAAAIRAQQEAIRLHHERRRIAAERQREKEEMLREYRRMPVIYSSDVTSSHSAKRNTDNMMFVLYARDILYRYVDISTDHEGREQMFRISGSRDYPQLHVCDTYRGGWDEVEAANDDGRLLELVAPNDGDDA